MVVGDDKELEFCAAARLWRADEESAGNVACLTGECQDEMAIVLAVGEVWFNAVFREAALERTVDRRASSGMSRSARRAGTSLCRTGHGRDSNVHSSSAFEVWVMVLCLVRGGWRWRDRDARSACVRAGPGLVMLIRERALWMMSTAASRCRVFGAYQRRQRLRVVRRAWDVPSSAQGDLAVESCPPVAGALLRRLRVDVRSRTMRATLVCRLLGVGRELE